ncbi:hypothetical protein LPJ60_000269 [Coemansia sp. RSA 2675]|nr:hypothetical protein LPJ60_000269 [Coemansia sp. RSA 2675]
MSCCPSDKKTSAAVECFQCQCGGNCDYDKCTCGQEGVTSCTCPATASCKKCKCGAKCECASGSVAAGCKCRFVQMLRLQVRYRRMPLWIVVQVH